MTTTLNRAIWNTDLELEIFNKIIQKHAPNLPKQRLHETKAPTTPEEIEKFYRFRVAGAAHDLFIVQVCAKVIGEIPDPDLQLFLSQQIGDDGAHAINTRRRAQEIYGQDPIDDIQKQVEKHWEYMGDLPVRNWQGFLAFELHYEMHIVASLFVNGITSTISDPQSAEFSKTRIKPEEARHRVGVVNWWQRKYEQVSPAKKADLAAQVLEIDEEAQRRRNPYLKQHWQLTHEAIGTDISDLPKIYDAWRREVLAYFLEIPVSQLPPLVSVND
ncbi:MAG: hypothetical protein EAZ76_14520 [Nostocales cyanobacterium]|nr:MAG: hypothetical protein EAZ87_07810 [Nostocales cyanobacterium]TAF12351.1 MAG: hypothetical protein EAZ76_14520 [Nostocales cyanobacterium]